MSSSTNLDALEADLLDTGSQEEEAAIQAIGDELTEESEAALLASEEEDEDDDGQNITVHIGKESTDPIMG